MALKINKDFAENFNRRKEKEELQQLKDKYGDEPAEYLSSSSSSESEDDDGKALTDHLERDILRTISALKSKDPRCYDPGFKFYDDVDDNDNEESDRDEGDDDSGEKDEDDDESDKAESSKIKKKKGKEKKEKPMFLKDYERKVIVEREGKLSDDESDAEENEAIPVSYADQQEKLKQSIIEAAAGVEKDDDEFLKPKTLSIEEKRRKEEDYLEWLKGHKEDIDESLAKDLAPLRNSWMNPDLDEKEKFLRDYILNHRYRDDNESDLDEDEIFKEAEDDEEEYDAEELFATKVNFRFQEEDKEFIKNYPRTIGESLRVKDNRRAEKRQKAKERKLAEKQKETEELKRLKNLKKKEILEKFKKLKEIIGDETVELTEDDLEGDFDESKHDAVMQKLIGEDYYDQDDDEEKPTFSKEDFDDDDGNWDGIGEQDNEEDSEPVNEKSQPCNSEAINVLDDKEPKEKSKNKKKSKFTEELEKLRQSFDPTKMTQQEYINEVLSRMDYEDKIGGVAFRFNYRNVIPCDYGLTAKEILNLPERELNSWVSVKKMCQYRTEEEEKMDVRIFKKKSNNFQKKMNILPSLQSEASKKNIETRTKAANSGQKTQNESIKKQQKKRKNKEMKESEPESKRLRLETPSRADFKISKSPDVKLVESAPRHETTTLEEVDKKKDHGVEKKKRKKKHGPGVPTLSKDRLKAYGINEKKFKYVVLDKLHKEMKNAKGGES